MISAYYLRANCQGWPRKKRGEGMTYTVGICDDCAQQVELFAGFLRDCVEYGEFRIIHASEPEAFFEKLKAETPDLVFLDIEMENMNGIELGEKIRALYENTVIIYITGYEKYAFEAFQLRAFHYLLKPVTKERFVQVLSEALKLIRKANGEKDQKTFSVQVGGKLLSLYCSDICYFEKIGHQIKIHTSSRDNYYYGNLSDVLKELDGEAFIQCHQGYIANVDKVMAFQDKTLFLDGNEKLPVSRTFADQVREALKKRLFAGREDR
jgi:DNA-binding LytR/AlgR family response regulator